MKTCPKRTRKQGSAQSSSFPAPSTQVPSIRFVCSLSNDLSCVQSPMSESWRRTRSTSSYPATLPTLKLILQPTPMLGGFFSTLKTTIARQSAIFSLSLHLRVMVRELEIRHKRCLNFPSTKRSISHRKSHKVAWMQILSLTKKD